ncbi:hypothetical protein DPMN_061158 [Dreissena polymorpha]|uniref:Uncharacterized protein n=1 Tax=Dreissena polymorpha TaxID=45954 RepID=A0A9D4HGM9_DREPO|nr:hypothetical protein DPMN_061158 [Dreissena polymorpha]
MTVIPDPISVPNTRHFTINEGLFQAALNKNSCDQRKKNDVKSEVNGEKSENKDSASTDNEKKSDYSYEYFCA